MERKKRDLFLGEARISTATEMHTNHNHENIMFDGFLGLKRTHLKYASCDIKTSNKQITGHSRAKTQEYMT